MGDPVHPYRDDSVERTIRLTHDHTELEGTLGVPENPRGVVLFAHGSGSSRFSSRNRYVARALRDAGLATVLLDLLSPREEQIDKVTAEFRFDIPRLADRLVAAIDWLATQHDVSELDVGLFGASTGGGAALVAAAERPHRVGAVVSRGGRPDLAGEALSRVSAPTLLIVGGFDEPVIDLNEKARAQMRGEVRIEIVPRTTHLFEEPGALERVAELARDWFLNRLGRGKHEPLSHR